MFFSEMRKRYSREELNSDDFDAPKEVAEQVLYDNWRMIISEYRKIAELTAEELSYIYLFVDAVPLYICSVFRTDE